MGSIRSTESTLISGTLVIVVAPSAVRPDSVPLLGERRRLDSGEELQLDTHGAPAAGNDRGTTTSTHGVCPFTPQLFHARAEIAVLVRGLSEASQAGKLAQDSAVPLVPSRSGPVGTGGYSIGLRKGTAAGYPRLIPRSSCRSRMVSARFRIAGRCRRPMGSFSIAGTTLMATKTGPFSFMIFPTLRSNSWRSSKR